MQHKLGDQTSHFCHRRSLGGPRPSDMSCPTFAVRHIRSVVRPQSLISSHRWGRRGYRGFWFRSRMTSSSASRRLSALSPLCPPASPFGTEIEQSLLPVPTCTHKLESRPFSYPSAPTLTCQPQRSNAQFSQNVGHRLFALACRRLLTLFQARERPTGGSHRTRRREFGHQRHTLSVVCHHQGRRDTDLSCRTPRHGPRSRTQ